MLGPVRGRLPRGLDAGDDDTRARSLPRSHGDRLSARFRDLGTAAEGWLEHGSRADCASGETTSPIGSAAPLHRFVNQEPAAAPSGIAHLHPRATGSATLNTVRSPS